MENNAYKITYILRRRGLDIELTGFAIAKDEEVAIRLVEEASREKIYKMKEDYGFVLVNIKKAKYDFLLVENNLKQ